MQIIPRATLLAVALIASTPLLAADSGSPGTSADSPTKSIQAATEPDNCTLPALPPMELSPAKLAGLLPMPGSTPPDPAEIDRRLRKAEACARAAGLKAPGESTTASDTTDSTPNRDTVTQSTSTGR